MGFQIFLSSSSKCKRNSVGESTDNCSVIDSLCIAHSFIHLTLVDGALLCGRDEASAGDEKVDVIDMSLLLQIHNRVCVCRGGEQAHKC